MTDPNPDLVESKECFMCGHVEGESFELESIGLTPQQEIRSRALDNAVVLVPVLTDRDGMPRPNVDAMLTLARLFAAWVEHGDQPEGADHV